MITLKEMNESRAKLLCGDALLLVERVRWKAFGMKISADMIGKVNKNTWIGNHDGYAHEFPPETLLLLSCSGTITLME
jgi:hypothetical protein